MIDPLSETAKNHLGGQRAMGHAPKAMTTEYVRARIGDEVSPVWMSGLWQTRKNVKMAKRFAIPDFSVSISP
jgi:hypothetical protein